MTNASKFAVELELKEQQLYRALIEMTQVSSVRNVLSMMIDDEQAIIARMAKLCQTDTDGACIVSDELNMPQHTLFDDIRPEEEIRSLHDSLSTYRLILRMVEGVERIYETTADRINNPQVKKAFADIIAIKRSRLDEMEDVFQFANAPNEYLEWGEFSNQTGTIFHQFGRDIG